MATFPSDQELRNASTSMLFASALAPYSETLRLAALTEQRLNDYQVYARALGVDESHAEEILSKVRTKAEDRWEAGWQISMEAYINATFDEARRGVIAHISRLPFLPFMAAAEPLLRDQQPS